MVPNLPLPNYSDEQPGAPEAVVAGHICLDVIPTLTQTGFEFSPGKLVEAGDALMSTGGAVANTGLCLNRLGIKTALLGKVGDDLFADTIRRILESFGDGLSNGLIVSPGEQTSYSIIISPPGADRMFLHAPGCNATFSENDIDYSSLSNVRLFHFGYPPLMKQTYADGGRSLVSILSQAKAAGPTTSLDMSLPDQDGPSGAVNWRALLADTLPYTDIFAPSLDEILFMLHPEIYRRTIGHPAASRISPDLLRSMSSEILEMGAAIALIKLGNCGLYLRTAANQRLTAMGRIAPANNSVWSELECWAPCFVVNEVGTTGSGDATIAGFLMGLLRGMTPEECLVAATAVGASSVEAADSFSGVTSWGATKTRIESGWRRHELSFCFSGWQRNDQGKIWHFR